MNTETHGPIPDENDRLLAGDLPVDPEDDAEPVAQPPPFDGPDFAPDEDPPDPVGHKLLTLAGFDAMYVRLPTAGYVPATARQIPMLLDRHWPNIPIRNDKGKLLDIPELLVGLGAVATALVYDLAGKVAAYDGNGTSGTLRLPCGQRRAITPKFNPQIDKWLRIGGGARYPRLETWLATAGRLDRPTAALYLRGKAGCGKGMLPLGVARLYGLNVASYRDVLGSNFNSALLKCPIVHLDEGAPGKGSDVEIDTETFRSFVSESARPLTEKWKPAATLLGCPRLIISANHYDALKLRYSDTLADDEAIGKRILLVDMSDEATAYLASIGGRDTTEAWINGDELPAHIAWLEKTCRPEVGKRFLVEGDGLWSEVQQRVREEKATAAHEAVKGTPLAAEIAAYLASRPRGPVLMDDVLRHLGLPAHDEAGPTPAQQDTESRIAAVLTANGYEHERKRINGIRTYAYWPPVSPPQGAMKRAL